jgi:hypothetical protein
VSSDKWTPEQEEQLKRFLEANTPIYLVAAETVCRRSADPCERAEGIS